jgi:hypothetical protein
MSERNKVTDLGENINNPLHLQPLEFGAARPKADAVKAPGR